MKKIGLIFLFLIVLSISVLGVKPANTFITTDSGLLLTAPSYNAYPVNTNLELYVHVFNSSDGMQLWNKTGREVSCFNDVYYPNGSILIEQGGTWINKELKLSLNTSGVSTGIYSYEVRCNTTNVGGELLNYFELTTDGLETPDYLAFKNNDLFYFIVFVVQIMLIILFILMGLPHKIGVVKIISWGLALIEILVTVWFVYIIDLGGDISVFIFLNAIIALLIGGSFGFYTLIIIMMKMMNPANSKQIGEDDYTKFTNDHDFNRKFN